MLAILGLVLFALLIGNVQRYLQSTTFRLEEWRVRRADTEKWMRRRLLPPSLRDSVRSYGQYKWDATRGVDEEALLKDLPVELRRNVKRHLCLNLLRRVPLLENMDDRTLDAICERLKPSFYTESTFLLKQGNPVEEMHFIIRGHLECITVSGDHLGYLDVCHIKSGDTCGDELLKWALMPQSGAVFPPSLWTVQAMSEVEAFSIGAEDLKFVTAHFRTMHSKKLRKNRKFYSLSWRTWAARFIQATWRRHKGIKAPKPCSIKQPPGVLMF
ncbi:hypothetical protein KSS87_013085 [Heliosperma pusillum]|nr:hypothetical protein KSS87_013085 [Heliosperma pusillum]